MARLTGEVGSLTVVAVGQARDDRANPAVIAREELPSLCHDAVTR